MLNTKKGEAFQFHKWYPLFKSLTFESVTIPLSCAFVHYLNEDCIYASKDDGAFPKYNQAESTDEEETWNAVEELKSSERSKYDLNNIKPQITCAIEVLGNVFPKLNWSAPQDAKWMIPDTTLCCRNADQVLLLLKSSDIIAQDLEQFPSNEAEKTSPFFLVLKKYQNLAISNEFRCFVKNNFLVGISQRYPTDFYPFLLKERSSLIKILTDFFHNNIQKSFPEPDYVFDVYVMPNKVLIIDFGMFGPMTNPCLFTWDEILETYTHLLQNKTEQIIFKVVESKTGIQPNEALYSRVPYDLKDISDESALKEYFENLDIEQLKKEQN